MTILNEKDIDKQILAAVKKKVGQALGDITSGKYPDGVKDRIVKRTRLGIGVDKDGNAYKFPALSDNYKEVRQGKARFFTINGKKIKIIKGDLVKKPRLHATTRPAKANNTATGQLLKSLTTVKLKIAGSIGWSIRVGDNRGRGLFGASSKIGNKELVGYLAAAGRRFMGITKAQRNEISRDIRHMIIKFLKS